MKQHELHTALATSFKNADGNPSNEFTITVDFRERVVIVKSSIKRNWLFRLTYMEFAEKSVPQLLKDIRRDYS